MKYKITFKTGNIIGAGTDANISLQLFDSNTSTHELQLNSKLLQFERGKFDSFYFQSEKLGKLEKIKIWHDNSLIGSKWFLDDIVIESAISNEKWYFPVFRWIAKDQKVIAKSVKCAVYNLEISTGTLPGSGTDDEIKLSLIGSKSYTPFFSLNSYLKERKLKTAHTDVLSILAEDIGKVREIKIKSTESSFSSKWFLSKIAIRKQNEENKTTFLFHQWIYPEGVYSSSWELKEYTIKFHTGDVAAGGTDANVSMIVYGSKTKTNVIRLNELIARNAFEAGKIDYIKIAHKNLGVIKKINIWHDEKWLGDGWYLNKISVKDEITGKKFNFPYYSWLDKSADPKSINIELTKNSITPRPFYAIAHMVNTPAYVEEALALGSNSIEFDITPSLNDNGNFDFNVFHGFRPDFDPDKINLMERSLASTELTLFQAKLREFEDKYKIFSLVIYDCKLEKVPKSKLEECGIQLANIIVNDFYSDNFTERIFTILSIAKKKSSPFFDGIMKKIPNKLLPYIGFDFSMEKFQTTENYFSKRKEMNCWWGSGIASTVPKPLKHFIPQFLVAAKKRTKRGVIKKIYYWTLDDPDSMARILVTTLDGIIVNDPLKLIKVLEKDEFRYSYRLATRDDNPFEII